MEPRRPQARCPLKAFSDNNIKIEYKRLIPGWACARTNCCNFLVAPASCIRG